MAAPPAPGAPNLGKVLWIPGVCFSCFLREKGLSLQASKHSLRKSISGTGEAHHDGAKASLAELKGSEKSLGKYFLCVVK